MSNINKHIVYQWATDYEPLSREQEQQLVNSDLSDQNILETLLKHNAKQIIKTASKWAPNRLNLYSDTFTRFKYPMDDSLSMVVLSYVKAYDTWNRTNRFYVWGNLYASSLLKEPQTIRKNDGLANFENDVMQESGMDSTDYFSLEEFEKFAYTPFEQNLKYEAIKYLLDPSTPILTPSEKNFIKDVYFERVSVHEASRNYFGACTTSASSYRHKKILAKMAKACKNYF